MGVPYPESYMWASGLFIASVIVLALLEKPIFSMLPTKILIDGDIVSLSRFRKYLDFRSDQVIWIERNCKPFYWTKVTVNTGKANVVFYIDPCIGSYSDLISLLSTPDNLLEES